MIVVIASGSVFRYRVIALAGCVSAMLVASTSPTSSKTLRPERVVSVNLCTDQLALLLAAPGQLVSVSHLAGDATISLMSTEAARVDTNHGLAEEVFRLNPDLVLAGRYTTRATVNLLKRLGKQVEEFDPARGLDDIEANTLRMGRLLGREVAAQRMVRQFRREVDVSARSDRAPPRPLLGSYGTNSYTSGAGTLENEIVTRAGFRHLGAELGVSGTTRLPLEALVLADPDHLLVWDRHIGNVSRAAEVLMHPALEARFPGSRRLSADSRYWICGTPLTAGAVRRLREAVVRRDRDE